MNIKQATYDKNLFRYFLSADGDLSSWYNWIIALMVVFGIKINPKDMPLITQCTGRSIVPSAGFQTALFLTGRRSGKSRISSIIGAFIAILSGAEKNLAAGETGLIAILAPTKKQAREHRSVDSRRTELAHIPVPLGQPARELSDESDR